MGKIDHASGGRKGQSPACAFTCFPDCLKRILRGSQVLVYLSLLAFDRGQGCFASLATIAKDVGLSRHQTWRVIGELRQLGVVSVVAQQSDNGDPAPNLIRCLVFVRGATVVDLRVGASAQGGSCVRAGRVAAKMQGGVAASAQGGVAAKMPPKTDPVEVDPRETDPVSITKNNNNADHERDRPPAPPAEVVVGGGGIPADLERAAAAARVPLPQVQEALAAHPPERIAAALQVVAQAGARSPSALFRKALAQGWSPATAPRRRREGTRNQPNWVGDAGDTAAIVAAIEARSR